MISLISIYTHSYFNKEIVYKTGRFESKSFLDIYMFVESDVFLNTKTF